MDDPLYVASVAILTVALLALLWGMWRLVCRDPMDPDPADRSD